MSEPARHQRPAGAEDAPLPGARVVRRHRRSAALVRPRAARPAAAVALHHGPPGWELLSEREIRVDAWAEFVSAPRRVLDAGDACDLLDLRASLGRGPSAIRRPSAISLNETRLAADIGLDMPGSPSAPGKATLRAPVSSSPVRSTIARRSSSSVSTELQTDYTEEMVLFVLDGEGAYSFEELVPIVQKRLLTQDASEGQIFTSMERLRKHGHIATAGPTDVRGGRLTRPQWLITPQGRNRLLALQMPAGTQAFAESIATVPVAADVMRIGSAASRWLQGKGLARTVDGAGPTGRRVTHR
jgi:hypothetical protein